MREIALTLSHTITAQTGGGGGGGGQRQRNAQTEGTLKQKTKKRATIILHIKEQR